MKSYLLTVNLIHHHKTLFNLVIINFKTIYDSKTIICYPKLKINFKNLTFIIYDNSWISNYFLKLQVKVYKFERKREKSNKTCNIQLFRYDNANRHFWWVLPLVKLKTVFGSKKFKEKQNVFLEFYLELVFL